MPATVKDAFPVNLPHLQNPDYFFSPNRKITFKWLGLHLERHCQSAQSYWIGSPVSALK